jgi:hypothetical protein
MLPGQHAVKIPQDKKYKINQGKPTQAKTRECMQMQTRQVNTDKDKSGKDKIICIASP